MSAPLPAARTWTRYVAIGDSFSEGMCDESPDIPGRYVGWTDRLAGHLARVASTRGEQLLYANLAIRGRLLDDITTRQLPAALAMQPDLVSIVGGGNDILRPRLDVRTLAEQLERAVVTIRSTGADVLLATETDMRDATLFKHLNGRHAEYTAWIWTIARRHGCHVIDQWGFEALKDWRMWAGDRLHLTSEGHRRVALAALTALGLGDDVDDPGWATPLPSRPPLSAREAAQENRAWVRDHVAPWAQRRAQGASSGDGISAKRPRLTPYVQ